MQDNLEKLCAEMVAQHGSPIIARSEVRRLTGGLLSAGYLANLDQQGAGPPGFMVGGRRAYRTEDFCRWFLSRCSAARGGGRRR
jgi:hypothetical protein